MTSSISCEGSRRAKEYEHLTVKILEEHNDQGRDPDKADRDILDLMTSTLGIVAAIYISIN